MLTLYRVLGYLFFPLALPFLLFLPKLRGGLRERLGHYPRLTGEAPRIWIHAASAGDVKAVHPLVLALRDRFPAATVVLTVATSTGREMARSINFPASHVLYAPVDLAHTCARAVRRLRPTLLLLEYAELWPNLVFAARRVEARIVLTNGRVSPRGFNRARLARQLYRKLLEEVDLCLMRSPGDADRIEALGAPSDRIVVTGNTKYDVPAPQQEDVARLRRELGLDAARPLLVLGNTHAGEEGLLLAVYRKLLGDFPQLQCLTAPRYPNRCAELEELCARLGLTTARRSGPPSSAHVLLLDSVGELAAAYGLGTVAFVGGSFTPRGGQNVLEPAFHGVPVLYGPSTANFRDEVELLTGRGGIQVADGDEFEGEVRSLLENPERRRALGQEAARQTVSLRGASAGNADRIEELLR